MKGYTFINLIIETLQIASKPLSPKEIWDMAVKLKLNSKLDSIGKTPWHTIGARLYTDIRDNPSSKFIQVSKRPTKFYLSDNLNNLSESHKKIKEDILIVSDDELSYSERDLHILLTKFVYSHHHFKCYTKTIFHEKSLKSKKGYNEWLHPDIVGIYFPFKDFTNETQGLQKSFRVNSYKLFSFEMKKKLTFTNLREYFFQAVSNSSWANEGYLVVIEFDDDDDLKDEMRRLNNSFGIGLIKLNPNEIEESEIVFPASEKKFIDWETVDRLVEENKDFKEFMSDLIEDIELGKVKSIYDRVLNESEYEDYIVRKRIKRL